MTLTMMKNSFGTAPCLMMETLEPNFLACLVEHSQGSLTSSSVTPSAPLPFLPFPLRVPYRTNECAAASLFFL